ncbi:hypothetical protein NMY22_g4057 [Coprinellus aureogranulatus]|nr:hypothetical protein NMY22_g4057 [Coprinellus aureogranulatus]
MLLPLLSWDPLLSVFPGTRPSAIAAAYRAPSAPAAYQQSAKVAAFIANSTTTSGLLNRHHLCNVPSRTLQLVGGGASRKRFYSRSELDAYRMGPPGDIVLEHPQYEFVEVIPAAWVNPEMDD